jgi:uncharacterized protein YjbJ (UPF0337 family)
MGPLRGGHAACFLQGTDATPAAPRFPKNECSILLEACIMDKDKDLTQRGAENQVKGKGKEIKGNIRETVGDMTDNESEQVKGKAQKYEGKAQQKFGKAERKLDEKI